MPATKPAPKAEEVPARPAESRATSGASGGDGADEPLTPEVALAHTRQLLEAKQQRARQTPSWQSGPHAGWNTNVTPHGETRPPEMEGQEARQETRHEHPGSRDPHN